MIKTQELRINNWVFYKGSQRPQRIIRIDPIDNTVLEHIEPIPLTPEILEKCGFKKGDYNEFRHTDLIGTLTLYDGICEIHLGDLYSVWIESLHRLQNLFYCLSGFELDIKL